MLNMRKKIEIDEIVKKHRICLLFLMLALLIGLTIGFMYKEDLSNKTLAYLTYISNQDEEQFIHDFTTGMEIQQNFSSYHDFDLITLSFSDHDTVQRGKMQLQVVDQETGEAVISSEMDMTEIHYAVPVEVSFRDIGGGKADHDYLIVLRSAQTEETAIGVYGYHTKGQTASVNGERSDYALSIGIHGYTKAFKILTLSVLFISMMAIIVAVLGTFEFHLKEQNIFLLLAIPFTLCMLAMWPGNHVYDEARHYYTVYNYSNRILGYGNSEDGTKLLMRQCDVPDSAVQKGLGTAQNEQAQSFGFYTERIMEKNINTELTTVDISYAPVVQNGTWIEYFPEIVGMTMGRILHCNYYWMGTLARLMNIACYMALCYLAICKTPTLKSLFVLLSALPMNLYQVSGISYDGFTFGVGIALFAFIMKLWVKGLERKDWILFAILSAVLGSCKGGVYLTLLILMFFIPKEQYHGKKWLKCIAIIGLGGMSMLGAFIPTFMRWFGIGGNISPIVNGTETVGGKLHLTFMIQNPMGFIRLLAVTLVKNADMYLGQMLGYRTAWAGATMSNVLMLPFLVLLIFSSFKNSDKDFEISFKMRMGISIILLIEIWGMHSIFLVETPINSPIIVGCQGRYFILFIPCILLLFRNNGIIFKEKREYLYPLFSMAQLVYLYYFLELFMCA